MALPSAPRHSPQSGGALGSSLRSLGSQGGRQAVPPLQGHDVRHEAGEGPTPRARRGRCGCATGSRTKRPVRRSRLTRATAAVCPGQSLEAAQGRQLRVPPPTRAAGRAAVGCRSTTPATSARPHRPHREVVPPAPAPPLQGGQNPPRRANGRARTQDAASPAKVRRRPRKGVGFAPASPCGIPWFFVGLAHDARGGALSPNPIPQKWVGNARIRTPQRPANPHATVEKWVEIYSRVRRKPDRGAGFRTAQVSYSRDLRCRLFACVGGVGGAVLAGGEGWAGGQAGRWRPVSGVLRVLFGLHGRRLRPFRRRAAPAADGAAPEAEAVVQAGVDAAHGAAPGRSPPSRRGRRAEWAGRMRRLAFAGWMRRVGPSLLGLAPALARRCARPSRFRPPAAAGRRRFGALRLASESVEGHGGGSFRWRGVGGGRGPARCGARCPRGTGPGGAHHGFARAPGRGVPVPAPRRADVDGRPDAAGVPKPALGFRLAAAPVGAEPAASPGRASARRGAGRPGPGPAPSVRGRTPSPRRARPAVHAGRRRSGAACSRTNWRCAHQGLPVRRSAPRGGRGRPRPASGSGVRPLAPERAAGGAGFGRPCRRRP